MRKRTNKNDDGFVLITVLGICFLAVMLVAALTAITISDLVSSARNRAVIEARNSAESSLDTLYAVVNRENNEDLIEVASANFVTSAGDSPISNTIDTTKSSGGAYNTSTVITQVYEWSDKWYSSDEDGNIGDCGLLTAQTTDDNLPCFKMRINRITTNPFGNSGALLNLTAGTTEADYQNANNTRKEYVVDVVVRHACLNQTDIDNPSGCVFSRFQQKIRKREFIQHVVISETEEVAPQVYERISDLDLQDRVKNLGNAYAANDAVAGNIHTNGASVFVCDGFGVTQSGLVKNWITSGYDSSSTPGSPTSSAATSTSNFSACNGSSGISVPRFTASRNKFPLPKRIGDANGTRLTSIAYSENASLYVLSGTSIRVNFRFDRSHPDQANWDKTGMMNPIIDGVDKGWYAIPSNGVLSLNPDNGNGVATVSGQIKGKLTIFSTGSIAIANSIVYVDTTMNEDLLGLYANKDIILNCYNDGVTQSGPCNSKVVHGLLWAGNQTLIVDPLDSNAYIVSHQGTIYNDHWNDSHISDLNNPPTLTIKGAMISFHRGTFSTIESSGAGRVTSGWQKAFSWDPRLSSEQPPYMLRDALASFIRSTAKDIPCDQACY